MFSFSDTYSLVAKHVEKFYDDKYTLIAELENKIRNEKSELERKILFEELRSVRAINLEAPKVVVKRGWFFKSMKISAFFGIVIWIVFEIWCLFHLILIWDTFTHLFNFLLKI
jgi:hypothetical protein